MFDSSEPHTVPYPEPYEELVMADPVLGIHRMCVVRCLRLDKTMDAVQSFVMAQDFMGHKYV